MNKCWWCQEREATRGWACDRCYPLKEEAYKDTEKKGIDNYYEIMVHTNKYIQAKISQDEKH